MLACVLWADMWIKCEQAEHQSTGFVVIQIWVEFQLCRLLSDTYFGQVINSSKLQFPLT